MNSPYTKRKHHIYLREGVSQGDESRKPTYHADQVCLLRSGRSNFEGIFQEEQLAGCHGTDEKYTRQVGIVRCIKAEVAKDVS